MKDIATRLTWHEVAMGAHTGLQRHMHALARGYTDKYGFDGDGWGIHIEGACGEIAAAKVLGVYWGPTVNTFSGPDLGLSVQVRTRLRHDYELIVRPGDDDTHFFLHVTGKAPDFIVHGWIYGADAKQERWFKDHGDRDPAWFVPSSELLDLDYLIKKIAA